MSDENKEKFKEELNETISDWSVWLNKRIGLSSKTSTFDEGYIKIAMSGLAKEVLELKEEYDKKE